MGPSHRVGRRRPDPAPPATRARPTAPVPVAVPPSRAPAAAAPDALAPTLARAVGVRAGRTGSQAVLARTLLAGKDLENAVAISVRYSHSPEPGYKKYAAPYKKANIAALMKLKKIDCDDDDLAAIEAALTKYDQDRPATDFDSVVDALTASATQQGYAPVLKAMTFHPRRPKVVFGPTLTTGFFERITNTITLDPEKNSTADALLDTLLFEANNAVQRAALTEAQTAERFEANRGLAVAAVEYVTDKRYVEGLMAVHGVQTIDALVAALGIPQEYLVEADYETAKDSHKVDRPDRSALAEQDKRQALWWWKTRNWTDEQRKEVWIAENHGEGVGSSEAVYT